MPKVKNFLEFNDLDDKENYIIIFNHSWKGKKIFHNKDRFLITLREYKDFDITRIKETNNEFTIEINGVLNKVIRTLNIFNKK